MQGNVQLATNDPFERRVSPRPLLEHRGTLNAGGQHASMTIRDLTREGCRIETDLELVPTLPISIEIFGIDPVLARVIWKSDREYGCAFERRLPPGCITKIFSNPSGPVIDKFGNRSRIGIIVGSIIASWVIAAAGVLSIIAPGLFA